ncbi:hypothetical protein HYS48_00155 [Candidatus Woesearchaeota archaeon]|nr:hypothetical protein [Candidatus Woesearchaeota archaeon]
MLGDRKEAKKRTRASSKAAKHAFSLEHAALNLSVLERKKLQPLKQELEAVLKQGLDFSAFSAILAEKREIPLSIFDNDVLSVFEAIVKYLHDSLNLRFSAIAQILQKSQKNVWLTYRNAKQKHPKPFGREDFQFSLPCSLFADARFTILELVVAYLRKTYSLSYNELAHFLHRDPKVLATIYSHYQKKGHALFEILGTVRSLQEKYHISDKTFPAVLQEALQAIEHPVIPLSIFTKDTKDLGATEIVVKYLREHLEFSFSQIAEHLRKSERNVRTSYTHAKQKQVGTIQVEESDFFLPLANLQDSKFTVIEHLVVHLREHYQLRFSEIARLLERNERTIWTVYARARRKAPSSDQIPEMKKP